MKKILFVPWTFSGGGGSENVLKVLVQKISEKEKMEIDIFEIEKGKYKIKGIETKSFISSPDFDRGIVSKVIRNFKLLILKILPSLISAIYIKKKYDAVISFNYLYPTFLISNLKGKKIYWMHGEISDLDYKDKNGFKKMSIKILYYLQKKAIKKADVIVGISNRTCESIIKIYPEYKEKVKKIYNGYNFSGIDKMITNEAIIKSDLVYVGRLDENKNVMALFEAVNKIKVKKPNIRFNVVGEGNEREELEDYIKIHNLEKNIKLVGYQENPYKYIKGAKINLLASHVEGFPTVLIEGLYLGVFFISTEVGGVYEISDNEKYGIVIKNEKKFELEILKVLDNYDEFSDLRKEASKYVEQFSEERFMENFLKEIMCEDDDE